MNLGLFTIERVSKERVLAKVTIGVGPLAVGEGPSVKGSIRIGAEGLDIECNRRMVKDCQGG